jgi:hypothetical protein
VKLWRTSLSLRAVSTSSNHCRQMGNIDDPEFGGSNQKVNEACIEAFNYCFGLSGGSFDALNNVSAMAETQFLMSEHSLRV